MCRPRLHLEVPGVPKQEIQGCFAGVACLLCVAGDVHACKGSQPHFVLGTVACILCGIANCFAFAAQDDDALVARATAELAAAIVQDASNVTAVDGRLGGKHHPQRTCEAMARQVNSLVRFGTAPEALSSAADGNRTCYASDDYSSGTLHTVHTSLWWPDCTRSLQWQSHKIFESGATRW